MRCAQRQASPARRFTHALRITQTNLCIQYDIPEGHVFRGSWEYVISEAQLINQKQLQVGAVQCTAVRSCSNDVNLYI